MSKRFTDTDKWKKPLLKSMKCCYKLLWLYICDDCDHAGIWHVDLEVATLRIGEQFNKQEAEKVLADKIVVFDGGHKWFIPSFIEFQYGELNSKNRMHESVLKILQKYSLIEKNKPLTSPLQGAKYKDKDKEQDKVIEIDEKFLVPEMLSVFLLTNKTYKSDPQRDYPELFKIATFYNVNDIGIEALLLQWKKICDYIATHSLYRNYNLLQVNRYIQSIDNESNNGKTNKRNNDSAKPGTDLTPL